MTVSINTVAITNLEQKVWTWKIELPQGNFLHSLTQPEITRQIPFKRTDIEYNWIKYEIAIMERVEYNTAIRRNVMNADDIEDFANL